ncbi:TadE/TadG family type IV pilus assembly protein [Qipengyuania nanhaisediminis]|uniref:TadE/TadG family type IV pilus assembly protein n=1 Tax=Qipengyuania nanhaisediminis TaxID=604088 RepID=UPI0038B2FE83
MTLKSQPEIHRRAPGLPGNADSSLWVDESGSLLPIAAMGFLVLAAIVGGGVDLSRASKAENRLQAACDAGVLAGRRAVYMNGFDDDAQAEANRYFLNNFEATSHGASSVSFTPSSNDNGNTVAASAQADVETTIMKAFGFDTIPITVTCSASMGVGNSDVTMVLDTTGSMGWRLTSGGPTKLSMLQDAMKNFYDTVASSTAGGSARIRYAFVPYSSTVNVGQLLYNANPAWLVDSMDIQSRVAVFGTETTQGDFEGWDDPTYSSSSGRSSSRLVDQGVYDSTQHSSRGACNRSKPSNTSWTNTGSASSESETSINEEGQQVTTTTTTQTQTRTRYTCVRLTRREGGRRIRYFAVYFYEYERDEYEYEYETRDPIYEEETVSVFDHYAFRQENYDTSAYKTFAATTTPTGDEGADQTSTWEGCIEERATTPADSFTFTAGSGITPAAAIDLDIDSVPTTDDDTKWRPLWPELAYYRTAWVSTRRGGYWDLTDEDETRNGGKAYSFCPQSARLLAEMSETAFDNYTDSLRAEGNTYHDLGILWGARLSSPQGIFASNVNVAPPNGGNVARHLIFMTDGQMQPNIAVQTAYGIEYHDKRVTGDGSDNHTERHNSRFAALCEAVKAKGIRLWVIAFATGLSDAMSECASDSSAFTADNASELNEAFQEIANEVGELRITQ